MSVKTYSSVVNGGRRLRLSYRFDPGPARLVIKFSIHHKKPTCSSTQGIVFINTLNKFSGCETFCYFLN